MKTIDYEFAKLCDEIDYLRAEVKHWKGECKRIQKQYSQSINNSIDQSKKQIGIMLGAMLDPNSIVNKGHREILEKRMSGEKD